MRSSIDDIPDEIPAELIPDTLKDLVLNDDGDLVDTKTGKVLNEFGATRFDVAVRAMRGEYDPIGTSTEHEEGQILDTLTQFPTEYTFQVSGRKELIGQDSALDDLCDIIGHVCGCEISRENQVEIKERGSSGKFLSVWVTCTVFSVFMVNEVLRQVKEDERLRLEKAKAAGAENDRDDSFVTQSDDSPSDREQGDRGEDDAHLGAGLSCAVESAAWH